MVVEDLPEAKRQQDEDGWLRDKTYDTGLGRLRCFGEGPMDSKKLMKTVGLSHRQTFLYDYLQPALDWSKWLSLTDPEAVNKKYRLTSKEGLVLQQLQEGGVG